MASVIDVTPVILLSRVLRVSQHCALVVAIGAPIIFLFDPQRWWLLFAVAAAAVYVALRYLPRPPILAWICSVTLGAIALLVWCLRECSTILTSDFTPRVIGPFVVIALVFYCWWRVLRESNLQPQRSVEPAMFGVVPEFGWWSRWKPLLLSAVLLILALLIFQPTITQLNACLAFGVSLFTGTALYFWLLPAVRAARNRFAVQLLREILRSRGHNLRRSYFVFVLSRMSRSPKSIGLVFCALLVLVIFTVIVNVLPQEVVQNTRMYLGGGLLSTLTLLWRRARRYALAGVIDAGSGPFILFLRSFMDDDLTIGQDNLITQLVMLGNFFPGTLAEANPRSTRFEELIAETVWPFGKMLAIGRPGEVLPQLGALRISTDNSGWQSMVKSLITRATHVLIAVGISSGIKWEFRQFEDGVSRLNLSLIILPEEGSVAATWRIFVAEYPELLACPDQDLERSVAVRFDAAGMPVFLCARKKSAEAYRIAVNTCLIPIERFLKPVRAQAEG